MTLGSLNGSWGSSASGRSSTSEASLQVPLGPRVPGHEGRVARREPPVRQVNGITGVVAQAVVKTVG